MLGAVDALQTFPWYLQRPQKHQLPRYMFMWGGLWRGVVGFVTKRLWQLVCFIKLANYSLVAIFCPCHVCSHLPESTLS